MPSMVGNHRTTVPGNKPKLSNIEILPISSLLLADYLRMERSRN